MKLIERVSMPSKFRTYLKSPTISYDRLSNYMMLMVLLHPGVDILQLKMEYVWVHVHLSQLQKEIGLKLLIIHFLETKAVV